MNIEETLRTLTERISSLKEDIETNKIVGAPTEDLKRKKEELENVVKYLVSNYTKI